MGITKKELFTVNQNKIASMAKALAHPARIAILEFLMKNDSCVCGDIVDELPLSQSTISQHLKAMKEAGIIKGKVDGSFRCYCLNKKSCAELTATFQKFFSKMFNCC